MSTLTATSPDVARTQGMLLVFLAGVLWSTVGLGIRLIEEAQVWQILIYRSAALSLLLFVVIRLRSGRNPFALARRAGWIGFLGAVSLVAAYSGGIYAIQTTSVANAMLLFASAPFMTAILGLLILRERVRWQTWAAIALAIAGITVMVWDKSGATQWSGNLAALGSAFGFAVFTITLRINRAGETLPIVFLSGIIGIPIMILICTASGLPLLITPRDTSIALAMGMFQVGAGLVLYTLGSRSVPAVELTLLSLAEVVLAPFWVWLVIGEVPSHFTIIGGAILLLAIIGNAVTGIRRKPPILPG
ncbi:DMT family transporter [Roseovarius faecimaris]|uniref:DMT family transporter n=1 Tax=Roseovarius faecimaris TaxID=2494550 RepID=A0A6I6IN00_9RHOB|nr:DMT family transporter [Roseovarius faecimaris]QGX98490.1 DMT family transporter [Roseovarius faecimaris]